MDNIINGGKYIVSYAPMDAWSDYVEELGIYKIKGTEKESLLAEMPKGKECVILENYFVSYENGYEEWSLTLITKHRNKYYYITDAGSN